MSDIRKNWISLNEKYDQLILQVLDGGSVDVLHMKSMQADLFQLEQDIFQDYDN